MLSQGVPPDQSANTSPEAGHKAASAGHHRLRQSRARHPEPTAVLVSAGARSEPGDPVCWGETSAWFYRGRSSSFPPRHSEEVLSMLYRLGREAWGKCDVLKGMCGEVGEEK